MADRNITMMDVHSALSHLLFAIDQDMPVGTAVRASYDQHCYLQIEVETTLQRRQLVVDRLVRGILWGPYDYRFKLVGCSVGDEPRQYVTAMVDMANSRPPSGPVPYGNTPRDQDERAYLASVR